MSQRFFWWNSHLRQPRIADTSRPGSNAGEMSAFRNTEFPCDTESRERTDTAEGHIIEKDSHSSTKQTMNGLSERRYESARINCETIEGIHRPVEGVIGVIEGMSRELA